MTHDTQGPELKQAILDALTNEGWTAAAALHQWNKTYSTLIGLAQPGTYFFNIGDTVIDWSKS